MISDYEEDLDDFPEEDKDRAAESLVGAHGAESTDQWTPRSGITTKIPPFFDGSTSWFKYERSIDDWLDLTVLEAEGDAEMHRGLRDREPLRAADGVKYSRDHHFINVDRYTSHEFFLERFHFVHTPHCGSRCLWCAITPSTCHP